MKINFCLKNLVLSLTLYISVCDVTYLKRFTQKIPVLGMKPPNTMILYVF